MKYQKLENQEAQWKWLYLIKKHRNGEQITRYDEKSLNNQCAENLFSLENNAQAIENWVEKHLSLDLIVKLDQAIRAKRKRFFNAEHVHTRKKSIDLDYAVWRKLADYAQKKNLTLSESLIDLMEKAEGSISLEKQNDL